MTTMKVLKNSSIISFAMLCLFSVASCSSQSIFYESIGYSDKPMPSIELKVSKDSIIEYGNTKRMFSIDKETFNALIYFLNKSDLSKHGYEDSQEYSYGSYRIIVENNGVKTGYLLQGREASLSFFKEQSEVVNNDRIQKEFDLIIYRLE